MQEPSPLSSLVAVSARPQGRHSFYDGLVLDGCQRARQSCKRRPAVGALHSGQDRYIERIPDSPGAAVQKLHPQQGGEGIHRRDVPGLVRTSHRADQAMPVQLSANPSSPELTATVHIKLARTSSVLGDACQPQPVRLIRSELSSDPWCTGRRICSP